MTLENFIGSCRQLKLDIEAARVEISFLNDDVLECYITMKSGGFLSSSVFSRYIDIVTRIFVDEDGYMIIVCQFKGLSDLYDKF